VKPLVIFGDHTCAVKLVETPFAQGADGIKILQTVDSLDPRFLFHVLRARPLESDGYQRHYSKLREHQIPLPPLEVQKEIVAEVEGYRKVIDGARVVLDNYRAHIPIHPDWPMAELGDVCRFLSGGTPSKTKEEYWTGHIPWVSAKDLKSNEIYDAAMHISEAAVAESATQIAPVGSLLILVRGMGLANGVPIGEVMKPCAFNQDLKGLLPNTDVVTTRFLAFALRQQEGQFQKILETAAHGTLKINSDGLRQIKIPLPPLATQQAVVAEIDSEEMLVAANRELITRFEKKIQASLAHVWGEDDRANSEG
jgi:type I restriction enzyme M protein